VVLLQNLKRRKLMRRIDELEQEIESIQDEKMKLLELVRKSSGFKKSDSLNEFLKLNSRQEALEKQLETLQEEDY
jgi:cell division FtsZ-interacting protein ZapD